MNWLYLDSKQFYSKGRQLYVCRLATEWFAVLLITKWYKDFPYTFSALNSATLGFKQYLCISSCISIIRCLCIRCLLMPARHSLLPTWRCWSIQEPIKYLSMVNQLIGVGECKIVCVCLHTCVNEFLLWCMLHYSIQVALASNCGQCLL